jgi:hypothetical protein
VLGLGDEEAGDRLIVEAGEGVLEVELEGVLVLLLPLPPQFLRRASGGVNGLGFPRGRGQAPVLFLRRVCSSVGFR